MAVIALASPKGGCGKSTTAIVLAGSFAEQGYKVRIIDADPAQRVHRWAAGGMAGENISVVTANAQTIVQTIRTSEDLAQIVLIDVEGSHNMVVPLAIGQANFVIIPANPSAADVEEAIATVQLITETPTRSGKPVAYGLLWTRVATAIKSREFTALSDQIAGARIPVIGHLTERSAYKSLISFSTTLDQLPSSEVPNIYKARQEARVLADAVSAAIISSTETTA